MPVYSNVAGTWQRIKRPEINVAGTWTELDQAYVRVSGEYRTLLGWDVTVASFSHRLNVSAQEGTVSGVEFKPDGTKMYIVGISADSVFQYGLTTPWDLSTASYDGISVYVGDQDFNPRDVTFRPDGTRMFTVGTVNDRIYQYALSTPWDLSSVTFTKSLSVTDPRSVVFKPDGTVMYHPIFSGGIATYNLSTAWDIGTAVFSGTTTIESTNGLAFKPDGRRVYLDNTNQIKQFDLSTPWDLSTASSAGSLSVSGTPSPTPVGIAFADKGQRLYYADQNDDSITEYLL